MHRLRTLRRPTWRQAGLLLIVTTYLSYLAGWWREPNVLYFFYECLTPEWSQAARMKPLKLLIANCSDRGIMAIAPSGNQWIIRDATHNTTSLQSLQTGSSQPLPNTLVSRFLDENLLFIGVGDGRINNETVTLYRINTQEQINSHDIEWYYARENSENTLKNLHITRAFLLDTILIGISDGADFGKTTFLVRFGLEQQRARDEVIRVLTAQNIPLIDSARYDREARLQLDQTGILPARNIQKMNLEVTNDGIRRRSDNKLIVSVPFNSGFHPRAWVNDDSAVLYTRGNACLLDLPGSGTVLPSIRVLCVPGGAMVLAEVPPDWATR